MRMSSYHRSYKSLEHLTNLRTLVLRMFNEHVTEEKKKKLWELKFVKMNHANMSLTSQWKRKTKLWPTELLALSNETFITLHTDAATTHCHQSTQVNVYTMQTSNIWMSTEIITLFILLAYCHDLCLVTKMITFQLHILPSRVRVSDKRVWPELMKSGLLCWACEDCDSNPEKL